MKKEFPIKVKKMAAPKKGSKEAQLKMEFVRAAKKQTGTSNIEADKKRQAMAPGKRKSQYGGGTYYEYRANRSDKGVLLGIPEKNIDLNNDILKDFNYCNDKIIKYERMLIYNKLELKKPLLSKLFKDHYKYEINLLNKYISEMKQHVKELKKLM
jgi:hypothetical protein